MDDPRLAAEELRRALDSLDRTNALAGTWRAVYRAAREVSRGGIESLVDLGSGGGGLLRYLRRGRIRREALLIGLDLAAGALQYAARKPAAGRRARGASGPAFIRASATCLPFRDDSVDIVTSGLFLHHLDPWGVVAVLAEAKRVARRGVAMIDLRRSRGALLFTYVMTRLLSRSRVFHSDGPRSVQAAYTLPELLELALRAGLHGAKLRQCFPFRMILTWSKH